MFDFDNFGSRRLTGGSNLLLVFMIAAGTIIAPSQTNTGQVSGNAAVSPAQLSATFAEVAKKVEPAVVNIETKGRVAEPSAKSDTTTPADPDDIMDFFRRQLPRRPIYAVGSGFIVDKGGLIITNNHVIEGAARITVKLDTDEEYPATVVGADDLSDLAVLKIEAGKELPFVKLGNSDTAQVGDWVLALGSPFGLSKSVTAGIISQTQRETPGGSPFQKFIQTDAAINKGNSGGPLVNMNGEVIGINSQIATSTGDSNGVGFAFPANEAAQVYKQLVANGMLERVRYRTDPDWYEYRLTERAIDVYPVIVGLMRWAERHLAPEADAGALELIHRACGAPAEPYLACSHCHEPLTGRDIEARVPTGAD